MFSYDSDVELPFNCELVFSKIQEYDSALDKGMVATKLRTLFSGKSIDQIKWNRISKDRATGVYIGGGKGGLKGMLVSIVPNNNRRTVKISVEAPGYVTWLFLAFCLIGFAMPPLWVILIISYWSIKRQSEYFINAVSADLKTMNMA